MTLSRRLMRPLALALSLLVPALAASSCTSDGSIDNPVNRKLSWFSHVNGDDIRASCHAGSDDRLRIVFNGRYRDQVRVYDLMQQGGETVLKQKNLARMTLGDGFTLGDLGSQLGGRDYSSRPGEDGSKALWEAVAAAGGLTPLEGSLRLDSETLWWTAVGCSRGKVFFHAWQQDEHSGPPAFFPVISRLDVSGLAFPSPRPPGITGLDSPGDRSKYVHFELLATAGGVR